MDMIFQYYLLATPALSKDGWEEKKRKGNAYSFQNVGELRLSDVQLSEIKLGLMLFRSASDVIL